MSVVAAVLVFVAAATAAETSSPLLPAYAHNDYENERPLEQALELGYRGVEADFFLVEGELLVAHDRRDVRPERTLEALYLAPLRERIRVNGSVHADGSTFYLNIEAKESGRDGYEALRALLARYAEMLFVVEDGKLQGGPVMVTLVGWHPTAEELLGEPTRYVGIHRHIHEWKEGDGDLPRHLLRMITVEYRRLFRWTGRGRPPRRFERGLNRIRQLKAEHPETPLRVIRATQSSRVYEGLLTAGVDLIAAKNLEESSAILRGLTLDGD